MKGTPRATGEEQSAPYADKLYMENTLLRVAGALFCHDAKSAASRTQPIELNQGIEDKKIIIRPDPEFGQPGPLAHKIFVALVKKHSGYGRTSQPEISFSKRELMRLVGRNGWGGQDSEDLSRALNEIHYAFVRTKFKDKDKQFTEHSFNIFPEIFIERRESATDPIEACTVTLARPIMTSLQDGHFTCLNHALMQELGTIGQALYMRLFFHFANLYDGHHKKRLTFAKRYEDICAEWLGGLTVVKYRSKIEERLGVHLRQLVQSRFLASYSIAEAKGGDGFVIFFRPGDTFFVDYDRFYRYQHAATVQVEFHEDRRSIADPLKLAYLFIEKRMGKPQAGIPYVPTKDVETAKFILTKISIEQAADFIEYGLAQAKRTRFDVQSLGGLRQYLSGYLDHQNARAAAEAARAAVAAEERATRARVEYSYYRRLEADRIFKKLSPREQADIEARAQGKATGPSRQKTSLGKIVFEIERARITAERHSSKFRTFEQWQNARLS